MSNSKQKDAVKIRKTIDKHLNELRKRSPELFEQLLLPEYCSKCERRVPDGLFDYERKCCFDCLPAHFRWNSKGGDA